MPTQRSARKTRQAATATSAPAALASVSPKALDPTTLTAAAYLAATRTEADAAGLMWDFYRQNKPQLIADIREYRDLILAGLMAGRPAAEVFAPYFIESASMKLNQAA